MLGIDDNGFALVQAGGDCGKAARAAKQLHLANLGTPISHDLDVPALAAAKEAPAGTIVASSFVNMTICASTW
jgi:hypothetical protein